MSRGRAPCGTFTPFGSTTAWPVAAAERLIGREIGLGAAAAVKEADAPFVVVTPADEHADDIAYLREAT